ncbi:hypothetical protein TPHA_0A00580 [Tetrapisispora phaffii CBS 4417]|uniref:Cyclin-like domain-containing protein n=1 Tax=Tetrapisispora phaffii (strain ATCC 24235 / CBS 4417 / NBRC 1672 / NRRL Y-8282 / UCD 70-5) TaxID=1071381 RepID=G8BML5_TETPH|nr:hypothetical protein TPHA_0A00580 [Tetrapisispora phaffii CBS 4417]CCE61143.1 hypothetical protein TPHA_0A00580 [Tetrapisispora phaffii CBS 4417]
MTREHKNALRILMKSPVTDDMIKFLTHTTLNVLPNINNELPSPPVSPGNSKESKLPSLKTFITKLVRYTNVYTSTLLTTACYLKKLQRILPKDANGLPSTIHRIFLACLILSAKFHNDSSPLNKHWAEYTDGLFSLEDVNLMEVQLLALLNWDIRIKEEDLFIDLRYLLEPIIRDLEMSAQRKRHYKQQQQQQLLKAGPLTKDHTNSKVYNQRNISIDSNLSSLTLTESNSTVSLHSSRSMSTLNSRSSSPLYAKPPKSYVPNINQKVRRTEASESDWDLEDIMAQYGF